MYKSYKEPFYQLLSFLGKRKEAKTFSKTPLFIGGCGRSGTTILLSVLAAHPEIFAIPRELGIYNTTKINQEGLVEPGRMDRLYRSLVFHSIKPTATFWCEKSPSNVKHIQDIASFHQGDYRFIHIIRDGRDVVLSKHPTKPNEYWVEPSRWVNDVKAGLKEKDNPKVLTIFYEDFMTNTTEVLKKICSFLAIDLHPDLVNWYKHTTVKKNAAYFGEVKQLDTSSIGKWKKEENAERVNQLLNYPGAKELLVELGYIDQGHTR